MSRVRRRWLREYVATWQMAGVCVGLGLLVWLSCGAAERLRRTQAQLAEQRARETADLLVSALGRDMRGAQELVLSREWEPGSMEPPFEARHVVADVFARYPYPESFFAWKGSWRQTDAVFFNRADRRPGWAAREEGQERFPVTVGREPVVSGLLVRRVLDDVRYGRLFSTFEITLGGIPYQVVARLFYGDPFRERLDRVTGFTVNLPWVRQRYVPDMTREVGRIGPGVALAVVDERGARVSGTVGRAAVGPVVRRSFPVMFFDPLLVAVAAPRDLPRRLWTVEVDAGDDAELGAAASQARRMLLVTAFAVAALAVGLALTARAARASALLAGLRAEFVSTVTHELKSPIATIRAAGETLARGRVTEPEAMREYAQMVVQESRRLTRLVDNLLAYSRVTDVTEVYAFEAVAPCALVGEVLKTYARQLAEERFTVVVEVPDDLPPIRGDRTALRLAIDNLVDNAIRYSGAGRWLCLRGRAPDRRMVSLEVCDRGVGIPEHEIPHVTQKFFRGGYGPATGSGLGLAIVRRIVEDHSGRLTISSAPGRGTTVRLDLPAMEDGGEEAGPGRRG